MANYVLSNILSSIPLRSNNQYDSELVIVENNAGRPITARASYITNFDDLVISLNTDHLSIGDVNISDPNGLNANVVPVGVGQGALRVLTQDLDSQHDSFTIGDVNGNLAYVTNSALNVNIVSETKPTFFQFNNFGTYTHRGWTMSDTQIPMLAVRVKPNQNITAKIAEYEIGNNNANQSTIGYVWYENPTLTGSYNWVDLNSQLQYAIFTDAYGSNTPNGISGGTTRHSGIVIGKNSSSEVEISEIPLTGGASPNVLALAVQRLDSATKLDVWFAVTLAV